MFVRPEIREEKLTKKKIEIIQINMGNKCNQVCSHCHIGASPQGKKNMDHAAARKVLDKLVTMDIERIEFTGGTPELNRNFPMFIDELSRHEKKIAVRTSLTVLDDPEYALFVDFYRRNNVKIIASLPSVFEEVTDKQRGSGVFSTSIKVLKKLNALGYGAGELSLDLVYNPVGDYLPPDQTELEKEYRQFLRDMYGISFDSFITIVNSPIRRFRNHLNAKRGFDSYMNLLTNSFNRNTLENVMCRHLLSIDYQGFVYDCDFNLALGMRIRGHEERHFWEIDFEAFYPEIIFDRHCYACTANRGSGCHGVLVDYGSDFDVKGSVRRYYGEELRGSSDLKTTACCSPDAPSEHIREVLPYIAEEIKMKYYGCGSPIPMAVEGLRVLDLGCGTGRDSYVLSRLVGEDGFVCGIDMTEEQIRVARRHVAEQTKRFGYERPNVEFIHDCIENAGGYFPEASLDLVISNCVINLVEDKEEVLRRIYGMLKMGGEFYFSDIYSDRRIPEELMGHHILYGECLGGALYYKDFERISRKAGFADPRVVSKRALDIKEKGIKDLVGNIAFYSITYRLWKLDGLEDGCEDYGHIAVYKGGVPHSPFRFELDSSHVFEKNRPEKVCGNTALMLSETRLKKYFRVAGGFDEHFGEFRGCSTDAGKIDDDSASEKGSCC